MPSGLFYLNSLDCSISIILGVWLVLIITIFLEIPVCNANGVDKDQTPRSTASDLGLHCLPSPFYWTLGINALIIPWFTLFFNTFFYLPVVFISKMF